MNKHLMYQPEEKTEIVRDQTEANYSDSLSDVTSEILTKQGDIILELADLLTFLVGDDEKLEYEPPKSFAETILLMARREHDILTQIRRVKSILYRAG